MSLREAAEKALEALEITTAFVDGCPIDWGRGYVPEADEAITTLRTALAEAEKPPRREPLTEEQITYIAVEEQFLLVCDGMDELIEIVRAVERAHGIGPASHE